MAVEVASIALVGAQVLEMLLAAPKNARYTYAIGQNSEFQVKQEIADKIIIVDRALCLDIMSTPGHWYANKFMALDPTDYDSGDKIAEHIGNYGDIRVSISTTYKPGKVAKNRDEVLQMNDCVDMYGKSRFFFIENGFCYHCGDKLKGHFHVFATTVACQSPKVYEDILIYGTISLSEKVDAADPFFRKYDGLYQMTRGMAKAGAEFLPAQEQLEAALQQVK